MSTSTVCDQNNLTLDDLVQMSLEELQTLYKSGTTPKLRAIEGKADGMVLAGVRNPDSIPDAAWKGKNFRPLNDTEGLGTNRLEPKGTDTQVTEYQFKFTLGDPVDGDTAVIVLDYNNNSNPESIRIIRDDVLQLNETLYLGRMYQATLQGFEFLVFFGLYLGGSEQS